MENPGETSAQGKKVRVEKKREIKNPSAKGERVPWGKTRRTSEWDKEPVQKNWDPSKKMCRLEAKKVFAQPTLGKIKKVGGQGKAFRRWKKL